MADEGVHRFQGEPVVVVTNSLLMIVAYVTVELFVFQILTMPILEREWHGWLIRFLSSDVG